jgi:PilZ domain
MNEQRDCRRQRVLKSGTIAFNGSSIDCLVRNISMTGAALEVESHNGIPLTFDLIIAPEKFSERCRVLWRKDRRIGVVFQPELRVHRSPPLAPRLGDEI